MEDLRYHHRPGEAPLGLSGKKKDLNGVRPSVRSGPVRRPVCTYEFPRRFISVNLHNPMSFFPHESVLVLTHVTVPMSSHVSILVLTHVCCFLRLH